MKFAIIGGNTRWSKILIKNFKKFNQKLLFTSSSYIDKKNNYKDFKKIPIKSLDFIVLASDVNKNFGALKFFYSKKKPIFIEKPITNNFKNYLTIKKLIKSKLIFVHYQHMYSDPINFLIGQLKKEKLLSIDLFFGKNGPTKKINSSYEWLPHPLSILFNIINNNINLPAKYSEYINKKKTNIKIIGRIQKSIFLNLKTGNNFGKKKYLIKIKTNKNIYKYNATDPKKISILDYVLNNKKQKKFKNYPLDNSINIFLKTLNDRKKRALIIKKNKIITDRIMNYLDRYKL